MGNNMLYFGDCLDVMREDIDDQSVDLIYLDPPFNSKRLYNAYIGGAQWVAFDDTWRWSEAVDDFHDVAQDSELAPTMEGLRLILGEGSNLAYLSYMANRLRECRRVLKDTGSIYLHCDPTMSHYLKVVMDGVFSRNFVNEIIWCYGSGGASKRHYSRKHDTILFFSASGRWKFNVDAVREPYSSPHKSRTPKVVGDRIYTKMNPLGRIPFDWWQLPILTNSAKERLGYPTQKPVALLERILKASSNPGDIVLDPFAGCGTTIEAAMRLNRNWIGIDVCVNACKIIEKRLCDRFEDFIFQVDFNGMPKTGPDARVLAEREPFKFERWAASLVDGVSPNVKQTGDGGIDGRGRFPIRKGVFLDVVSQVKGGHTQPRDVQAFNTARQQVNADLGVFTCFEDRVTQGMRDTAASAGKYKGAPCVQIYTVEDYFAGRRVEIPLAA